MTIPIYSPHAFLRCKKCDNKADHVLISIHYTSQNGEIEETYECQECGQARKIYELASPSHFQSLVNIQHPEAKH